MYYIDPDHNTLQNVLVCTLYIYTVHTNKCCKYAVGLWLFVVLRDFKCLQENTSVLVGVYLTCIWDMQYDIRREIKRTNNADCMCTVTLEFCVLLYMY